jgi:hypothetical protein
MVTDRNPIDARRPEDLRADSVRDAKSSRAAWEHGPALSDVERHQYEFEGGGAANQRQAGKRRGWLARLFR